MIVIENLSELLLSTRPTLFVTGKLISSKISVHYFIISLVYSMSTMFACLRGKTFTYNLYAIIFNVATFEKVRITNFDTRKTYYILR